MPQKRHDDTSNHEETKKQLKDPSEIKPRILIMKDGTKKNAYTAGDAAILLGVTPSAFTTIRKRRGFRLYKLDYGAERYILEDDINSLLTAQPVEE